MAVTKQKPDIVPHGAQTKEIDVDGIFRARDDMRRTFARNHGWDVDCIIPMGEDCAFRRYYRLEKDGKTVLLMDSVPELEGAVAPSHKLRDYVPLAKAFCDIGLSTPEVIAYDLGQGFALVEDFGDDTFNHRLSEGHDEATLYHLGVDVLKTIRRSSTAIQSQHELPNYYDGHVHANRKDLVVWYLPALQGKRNHDGMVDSYLEAWQEVERGLPPVVMATQHCDFHVDNLMVLKARQGIQRCGVLDFQGAVLGPQPYDLANLLEDARRAIPEALKQELKASYCEGMTAEERESFDAWYAVMATQFHCRVIGLFVRLLVRDGKDIHFHHIPRLQHYIAAALENPVLSPLKRWFDDVGLDITRPLPEFDPADIRKHIDL